VRACNAFSGLSLADASTLFFEFHGVDDAEVGRHAGIISELEASSSEWTAASEPEERSALWTARHNAFYATLAARRSEGVRGFSTDVCVPLSRLVDVIAKTHHDLHTSGLFGTIVGHVGDGNFHVLLPVVEEDEGEMKRVWAFSDRLVM